MFFSFAHEVDWLIGFPHNSDDIFWKRFAQSSNVKLNESRPILHKLTKRWIYVKKLKIIQYIKIDRFTWWGISSDVYISLGDDRDVASGH